MVTKIGELSKMKKLLKKIYSMIKAGVLLSSASPSNLARGSAELVIKNGKEQREKEISEKTDNVKEQEKKLLKVPFKKEKANLKISFINKNPKYAEINGKISKVRKV